MAERPQEATDEIADEIVETVDETAPLGARILPFPTVDHRRSDDAEPDVLLRDALGRVLRDERLEQERTLADVAETAHVSLPYLSEVERGTKEVSSDLLDAICDALELPLPDLLERAARHLRAGSVGGSGVQMLAA